MVTTYKLGRIGGLESLKNSAALTSLRCQVLPNVVCLGNGSPPSSSRWKYLTLVIDCRKLLNSLLFSVSC